MKLMSVARWRVKLNWSLAGSLQESRMLEELPAAIKLIGVLAGLVGRFDGGLTVACHRIMDSRLNAA